MNSNSINVFNGDFNQVLVKDIVLENFKVAEIMEKFGIDFCCNGKRKLSQVLEEKNISREIFFEELGTSIVKSNDDEKYDSWDLNYLQQYIVSNHHRYVRIAIPQIEEHLKKIVAVHGSKYNFLADISEEFSAIAEELMNHMNKEERILFPLIKYLEDSNRFGEKPKMGGFGTVKNPIMKMESEHAAAGDSLANIRNLTNDFKLPADACATFTVTYKELEEFEKDLHKHIHLENNILFPKAIQLEEELITKFS